jgi:hypothetical protein
VSTVQGAVQRVATWQKPVFMDYLPGPGSHSRFPQCPSSVEGADVQVTVPRGATRQKPVLWLTCQVAAPIARFHRVPVEGAGVQGTVPCGATRQEPVL